MDDRTIQAKITYYLEDATSAAKRAVHFDKEGANQETAAAYFYKVAADLLDKAAQLDTTERGDKFRERAKEYKDRSDLLNEISEKRTGNSKPQPEYESTLKKCYFLFDQGLQADEGGKKEEAIDYYTKAIELGLNSKFEVNEEIQKKIKQITLMALERAEQLKGIKTTTTQSSTSQIKSPTRIRSNYQTPKLHRGSSAHLQVVGNHVGTYTDEEKQVLMITSQINNIKYVPFMEVDLGEQFRYALAFTDPDPKLKLSPKQKHDFVDWCRPDQICSDPKFIVDSFIDCYTIKQTVISDCSFVASLAVAANYERRFKKSLISGIVYPRNSKNQPIYNPFGKYMIKLHLNGVSRKIIIDDYLPIGRYNQLLCSYSSKRNEFWVSLLEKAYMKVMGGYDFPGSNSNIDLHALTGWIPERVALHSESSSDPANFDSDKFFDSLLTRHAQGDCLVTIATGHISDIQSEITGLVSTHAYAMLNVKSVNGKRLLFLKNPWSHLRWRGNYSELDIRNWTEDLKRHLNYDPDSAAEFDNGVFWIDYESILKFFDVVYLNWNPQLFKYTYCLHQCWQAGVGPIKDAFTIGDNPQFALEVEQKSGAVWILLTRHIMQIDDFKQNTEYITVLVYKNNGNRVYYPNDPGPYIDGVRINSPHYLCKLKYDVNSPTKYTLVISQYEKMNTIFYTLRAYSTSPFKLTKILNPYVQQKIITDGSWDDETAGGCANYQNTYQMNPKYEIELCGGGGGSNQLYVDLKGPKEYPIGFNLTITKLNDQSETAPWRTKSSAPYRNGFVYMELDGVPNGVLELVPSTFYPGQKAPYLLTIKASCQFNVKRVR